MGNGCSSPLDWTPSPEACPMWGVGARRRPGSFTSCGPHMYEERIAPLVTLATPAQISTPSAAHLVGSHQILVQNSAADRDRKKSRRSRYQGTQSATIEGSW